MTISKEARLAELRARTDGELIRYASRTLASSMQYAQAPDNESYQRAEAACAEVARLFPAIQALPDPQRQQLISHMQKIHELLQTLPAMTQSAG